MEWKAPATRILAALILLGITGCSSSSPPPPAISPAIAQTVQLMHWWAFYAAAVGAPSHTVGPVPNAHLNNCPLGESLQQCLLQVGGGAGQPSMYDKYISAIIPPDMTGILNSEFLRLKSGLGAVGANNLSALSLSVRLCSSSDPVLLTTVTTQPPNQDLCLAPLLISSVFFESAGTTLQDLYDRLKEAGVDPGTFDGTYNIRVQSVWGKETDWNAVLSASGQPVWDAFIGSVDFIIARGILRAISAASGIPVDKASWDQTAHALILKLNSGFNISSLNAALESGQTNYAPASWGYDTAGDGSLISREFLGL